MNQSIYIALDFPSWAETNQFIQQNNLHGIPVKVGMELFYKEGPSIVEKLKRNGHPIFLDLKLHDIPNTVLQAMKSIASLDVDIVNVHALGGKEMMKWAKEGLMQGGGDKTKLIAVTILTSHTTNLINDELLIRKDVEEITVHLASLAAESGCDGVVCSAHEVKPIKAACDQQFLTVTPGIRLDSTYIEDQKRIATPSYAKKEGADLLVIGRSITKSANPRQMYEKALEEWNHGTK